MALPNRMNFRKGSKRQLTPTPTPQNGPYLWKSCACISYYLVIISPCIYTTISVIKNLQHNFPKMRRGGRRPFGSGTLPLFGVVCMYCDVELCCVLIFVCCTLCPTRAQPTFQLLWRLHRLLLVGVWLFFVSGVEWCCGLTLLAALSVQI